MLIRLGYDIRFDVPYGATFVAMLRVHPSRQPDLENADLVSVSAGVPVEYFNDNFGNLGARFEVPAGFVALSSSTVVQDNGQLDEIAPGAEELAVGKLPADVLGYLLSSRYCEVDLLSPIATELFGATAPGWSRVQAICDWVKAHVVFDYSRARPTKTALDVYTERAGVCRDFQHLAITFCRALNIPARYATGYLGDIGVPIAPYPMDFSAWFEAYLGGRWYTFDARHNRPRIGRILMATGRDATDVAITTTFGEVVLKKFSVVTEELGGAQ
jgi:transglutaminase-like putative cysteine protease